MKDFAVKTIVDYLKQESFRLIPSFVHIAQIIIGIFLAIELTKEAIGLAHGDGFHLSKKLITWVVAMVMISAFYYDPGTRSGLANGIYETAKKFGEYSFEQFNVALKNFVDNCSKDEPSLTIGSIFKPKKMFFAVGYAIGVAIGAVCFLLIYVMICGCYGCLALLIVMGPVAFAFMLNEDFRQVTIRWVNSIITNLFLIIVYGITMLMISGVLSATIKAAKDSLNSSSLLAAIMVLLIGPMLAVGLAFQGPKVVQSLLGGFGAASGGGEMAAGYLGGAIWSAARSSSRQALNAVQRVFDRGSGGGDAGKGDPTRSTVSLGAGGGGETGKGGEPAPGAFTTDIGNKIQRVGQNQPAETGAAGAPPKMYRINLAPREQGQRKEDAPRQQDKEPAPLQFADGAYPEHQDPGPAGE